MTSSLFATTVAASFFVVGLPHLLPCPVPVTRYADGDVMVDENGRRKRWKSKQPDESSKDGVVRLAQATDGNVGDHLTSTSVSATGRECPVPKPGGMIGEWLGFHKSAVDMSKEGSR
jgi:cytochrome c oxidase assembly factor 2